MLYNISDSLVVINSGERLAQAKLEKNTEYKVTEVKNKPVQKTDRDGGLGSTGK
jgi:dUTPase